MESNYTWKKLDWSIPSLYFTFSCIRGFVICVLLNNLFGEKPFAAIELLLHSLHILQENSTRLLIVTEVQKQPNPVMTGWTFVLMFLFLYYATIQCSISLLAFLCIYLFLFLHICHTWLFQIIKHISVCFNTGYKEIPNTFKMQFDNFICFLGDLKCSCL